MSKFNISYLLVLGLLFIGCGSGNTQIDKIEVTNTEDVDPDANINYNDIESFSYLYFDKNNSIQTLNHSEIFQITQADNNVGLFVYRKVSDYTKSLDYFTLDGTTATYSHTLDTFLKLETNLGKVIPLKSGKVAILKLGSMNVLSIYDYINEMKLSSVATNNFGQYISHDDNTIFFENKKVDISDASDIKFIIEDTFIRLVNGDHKVIKPNDICKLECTNTAPNPNESEAYYWSVGRSYYTGRIGPNKKIWTRAADQYGTTSFHCITAGYDKETITITVVPDDLKPSRSDMHVFAGENQNINLGDSITLSASDEYGFDPRSPENFRFDWILDGKIVSTTKRSFTFTPKKSGNYKFIVSAQDRNGNVAFDYVIVTVGD